jgi:hypothetical protein
MAKGTVLMRQVDPATFAAMVADLEAKAKSAAAGNEGDGLNVKPRAAVKERKARPRHAHEMRVSGNRKRSAPGPGIEVMGKPPKRTETQRKADARAHRKRLKAASLKPLATGVMVRRRAAK